MIYLIGGAPRCGKSTLADLLSQKTSYEIVSADSFEKEVKNKTHKFFHWILFPKDHLRNKTDWNNDLMYSRFTTEQISKAYIKQAKSSHRALSKLIKQSLSSNQNLIIEGHQIHPNLIKNLNLDPKKCKVIFLGKTNEQLIIDGFPLSSRKPDWVMDKTKDKNTFHQIAKFVSSYSKWFKYEAEKNNFKFYNIDKNFDNSLNNIVDELLTE